MPGIHAKKTITAELAGPFKALRGHSPGETAVPRSQMWLVCKWRSTSISASGRQTRSSSPEAEGRHLYVKLDPRTAWDGGRSCETGS